jgi:hypothetical protein
MPGAHERPCPPKQRYSSTGSMNRTGLKSLAVSGRRPGPARNRPRPQC